MKSLEKHEVTPLVVDGVMYTVQFNDVVALNAVTGRQIWIHPWKPSPDARNCCGQETRGLAIAGDKIIEATLDTHMIALDAKTGKEVWNVQVADPKEKYSFTHAPLVIKDKVIEGTAGGEFGIRGFIAAFDVNTGKEVWRFNTVAGPGEPGSETWAGDSWKHGGGSVWATGSYDPVTNLTFWGIGNPGPDWNGDGRKGDNLYSCSVVALDADTGKLKWYYQFSPHNEFDWDSTQIPVLADMQWKGRARKVMLWANRSGVFYVLDRTTGEFLLGKSFAKTNWYTGFDEKGRPLRAPGTEPTQEGVLIFPGNQGATNWYNPSYSPQTGLFYIPTWENTFDDLSEGQRAAGISFGADLQRCIPAQSAGRGDFQRGASHRSEDRQQGLGLQAERAFDRSRHPDHGVERAVQRRARRRVLCARCARRQTALGDQSRTVGFGRTDDVYGGRQAVREHSGGRVAVHVYTALNLCREVRRRLAPFHRDGPGVFAGAI